MQRKAILVLGMHRSGTSAFARMLSLLGCDLPQDLMPGWEGNPKGHWESNAVRTLNDEILKSAGSSWDDWLEFNPNWYQSPAYGGFFKRALDVLQEDYGTSPFFVLKDPRSCRLARFWLGVLEEADVEPLIAIPLRNPLEVADSLKRRNDSHPDIALLAWLRHVLDAERDSRGRRRVFTTYDQLLTDWSGVAEKVQQGLGITWPRFSPHAAVEMEEFLDQDSRHHTRSQQSVASNPMLSTWLREAHDIFFRWAEAGEDENDHGRLDDITAQFNVAGPLFVRLGQDINKERAEKQELLVSLKARDEKILQLTEEFSRAKEGDLNNTELQAEIDRLSIDSTSLKADKIALQDQLESLRDRAERLEAELGAAIDKETANASTVGAERNVHVQQLAMRDEAMTELVREKSAINMSLEATRRELENFRIESRDRQHALEVAQNTLRQREEEICQTRANLEQERERSAEAEAQRRLAESALADAEAKLNDTNGWVFRLAGERKTAEVRAGSAEARLAKTERALSLAVKRLDIFKHQQKQHFEEKNQLRKRNRELEKLSEVLRGEKDDVVERWNTAQSELATLSTLLRQKEAEHLAPQTQAASVEHRNEVAALSGRLRMREAEASRIAHQAEWLQEVSAVITSYPSWWSFAPKLWRRKWQHKRLLRKGLFDASTYLSRYPDVQESGVDPLRHYITHGITENRTFN